MFPFDLHVLGMPPAFVLSQNQTLQLNFLFRKFLLKFVRLNRTNIKLSHNISFKEICEPTYFWRYFTLFSCQRTPSALLALRVLRRAPTAWVPALGRAYFRRIAERQATLPHLCSVGGFGTGTVKCQDLTSEFVRFFMN